MIKSIVVVLVSILVISCQNENIIYSENQELSPEVEWIKSDIKEFVVPITEVDLTCKMFLNFRFITGYAYPNVLVKVTETSPSGKIEVFEYDLKVIDENGEYIGDPGLDIWDSQHLVETVKSYTEVGNYTYILEQNTPVDPLNHVMEIGIVLEK